MLCVFSLSSSLRWLTCLKSYGCKRMWTGAKQGHSARFLGKLSASETQMRKVGVSGEPRTQCSLSKTPADENWLINLNILKTTIHFLYIGTVVYRVLTENSLKLKPPTSHFCSLMIKNVKPLSCFPGYASASKALHCKTKHTRC